MTCSGEAGHPQYQDERAEDPFFDGNELLYRRFIKEHFQEARLLPAAFAFPRQSFNRGKYSAPEDVLHPDCADGRKLEGWGVLECLVANLPTPLVGADNRIFNFSAVHQPQECCYAHTEIWCVTETGKPAENPSKKVRETFRVRLAERMRVRIHATA